MNIYISNIAHAFCVFFYFLYFASFLEPYLANSDSLNSKNFADFSQYWK